MVMEHARENFLVKSVNCLQHRGMAQFWGFWEFYWRVCLTHVSSWAGLERARIYHSSARFFGEFASAEPQNPLTTQSFA